MDTVLGNIAASVAGLDTAPALLRGTGKDKVHLLIVCTAERGLCGAFNSAIVRLAREHANRLQGEGKTVKFLCVGRKGFEQLRRLYEKQIVEVIELRSVRNIGYVNAEAVAKRILALFDEGAFDIATLFFSRFRSVIAQIPTAQQIIPPVFEAKENGGGAAASYEYEPEEVDILDELLPTQHRRAGVPRAAGERRVRAGRAHERDGQRDAQRRRNDPQADHHLQPHAPGDDHQGADRDHLRRRSALSFD